MKSVSKFRFRPQFVTLESRTQPGTLLTSGLSSLGSALDLSSILNDSAASETTLVHRPLSDLNSTPVASGTGTINVAPSSVNATSTNAAPVVQHTDSNLAGQVIAVNAASHGATLSGSSTHVAPIANGAPQSTGRNISSLQSAVASPVRSDLAIGAIAAAHLQQATGLHLTPIAPTNGGGGNPLFANQIATFVGTATGTDSMNKISALATNGNVVIGGT